MIEYADELCIFSQNHAGGGAYLLVSLYFRRVAVYSDFVGIGLNNVPSNRLNPPVKNETLPAVSDGKGNIVNAEKRLKIIKATRFHVALIGLITCTLHGRKR